MKKINILILLFIVSFIHCRHNSEIYSNHSQVVKNSVNQKSVKQEQKQDSIQDEIVHFTGTIKMIETINSQKLQNIQQNIDTDGNSNFEKGITFIPVDNDPRWALVVHIESIQGEKIPFNSETDQIFGIHSPTKLFLEPAENVTGRTFEFELNWSINEKNQSTFKNIKADTIIDSKSYDKSPGYLLALHYQTEGAFDVDMFALLDKSTFRVASTQETCKIIKKGKAVDIMLGSKKQLSAKIEGSFLYDVINVCTGDISDKVIPYRKNLIGSVDIEPTNSGQYQTIEEHLKNELSNFVIKSLSQQTKGILSPSNFDIKLNASRFDFSNISYAIIEAKLFPLNNCNISACKINEAGFTDNKSPNSAVYIFDISNEVKNSRDAKNFQEIFNRITLLENPESFDSSISFVDFIFLDNNSFPWLVLFHEACDGWDFELLEPNSNGQGFTTRLSGAEGSNI